MRASEADRITESATFVFEARVAPELESIFCRGPEWESGVAHIFVLAPVSAQAAAESDQSAGRQEGMWDTRHPAASAGTSPTQRGPGGGEAEAGYQDRVRVGCQPEPDGLQAGKDGAAGQREEDAEVETYLQQLAEIAQISLANAVQATYGRLRFAPMSACTEFTSGHKYFMYYKKVDVSWQAKGKDICSLQQARGNRGQAWLA